MGRHYNRTRSFSRTTNWNFGPVNVTPRMLRVLSCITYATMIEDVEETLSMAYDDLCEDINKLLQLNLVTESSRIGEDLDAVADHSNFDSHRQNNMDQKLQN
jgi:hypothetical protein